MSSKASRFVHLTRFGYCLEGWISSVKFRRLKISVNLMLSWALSFVRLTLSESWKSPQASSFVCLKVSENSISSSKASSFVHLT